jgi:hypothetical protein
MSYLLHDEFRYYILRTEYLLWFDDEDKDYFVILRIVTMIKQFHFIMISFMGTELLLNADVRYIEDHKTD